MIRISYVTWHRPLLSERDERDLAERVIRTGREQLVAQFRESLLKKALKGDQSRA